MSKKKSYFVSYRYMIDDNEMIYGYAILKINIAKDIISKKIKKIIEKNDNVDISKIILTSFNNIK